MLLFSIGEPPLFYVARELACGLPYYDDLSQRRRLKVIEGVSDLLAPDWGERSFPPDFDFAATRSKIDRLLNERARFR